MYFSENLKFLSMKNKMSLSELSELTGKGEAAISTYRSGRSQPTLDILIKFSEIFGVSLDQLVLVDLSREGIEGTNKMEQMEQRLDEMSVVMEEVVDFINRSKKSK